MKHINIQILRALAAMAVVFYHSGIETMSICESQGRTCNYEIWGLGFGVPLFFIISGFIMVVTTWGQFGSLASAGSFLRRRIYRIVPLYWLVTTLAVVGFLLVPGMIKLDALTQSYVTSSYFFWPTERPNGLVRPIANLGWTLNLEMFFYVLFALALLLKRTGGLLLVVGTLILLSLLHGLGVFAGNVPLYFWSDPIILGFVAGIGVGVAYKKGYRINARQRLALLCAFVAAIVVSYFAIPDSFFMRESDSLIIRLTFTIACLPMLIIGALGPQLQGRGFASRAAMLIGDASYSLYLIHPFFLRAMQKVWAKLVGDSLPEYFFIPAALAVALAVGIGMYYAFERPVMKLLEAKREKVLELKTAVQA
jgi:exopolysaccharide production protein ExoZ